MNTLTEMQCDKQALEGTVINLIEEFCAKYHPDKIELCLVPINCDTVCGNKHKVFDVDLIVSF